MPFEASVAVEPGQWMVIQANILAFIRNTCIITDLFPQSDPDWVSVVMHHCVETLWSMTDSLYTVEKALVTCPCLKLTGCIQS